MITLLVILFLIIIFSIGIIFLILSGISWDKLIILKVKMAGEYLTFISVLLIFSINVIGIGSLTDNRQMVIEEIITDIDIRVDKLNRTQPKKDFTSIGDESARERISELEQQTEYSNLQIKIANIVSGLIGFMGTPMIFMGKIAEIKLQTLHKVK